MKILPLPIALLLVSAAALMAGEQPNILWITSEDNGAEWLGCYGNSHAQTPRLDALAASGVRFTHAYSNAAVCAVARSTILNGAYAPTQGTQHMRSRHRISPIYQSYVHYLRQAGYYCTNNSKTDYNFKGDDNAIWDASSAKAHYKNRPPEKPFFAVFNLMVSHESSLFPAKLKARYQSGPDQKTKSTRIRPEDVIVPPYLPDLPEIRSDIAIYHDVITDLDSQVGKILDELAEAGLAENTIVFYYSDHGGVLPRGKRYLHDTGVRVPWIIHVPKKWAALSPFRNGEAADEPVSFVDLAPTVLSLAGIDTPAQMQGRAIMGSKRGAAPKDPLVYLYADRFDELYGMRRAITDGRWKYIRCFSPHLPAAPYSFYPFQQAGWKAWHRAWKEGTLKAPFSNLWEAPQAVEALYDTQSDRWETNNLANDPQFADRLSTMRDRLRQMMISTVDTSIIPEAMFDLAGDNTASEYLNARNQDLPRLVDLAFSASSASEKSLPDLIKQLHSPDLLTRYWAAQGCLIVGESAKSATTELHTLLQDPHPAIRITAAHALHQLGEPIGQATLLKMLDEPVSKEVTLLALNALRQIGAIPQISEGTLKALNEGHKSDGYLRDIIGSTLKGY